MGKKKGLKRRIETLEAENKSLEFSIKNMEEKLKFYEIENVTLKERIKQFGGKKKEVKPCPFCGARLTAKKILYHEGLIDAWSHAKNECILAYGGELLIRDSDMGLWNKRAAE